MYSFMRNIIIVTNHCRSIRKRQFLFTGVIIGYLFFSQVASAIPVESFQTSTTSVLANPNTRSDFYNRVSDELRSDSYCIREYAGDQYGWNMFYPKCINNFMDRLARQHPDILKSVDIGKAVSDLDSDCIDVLSNGEGSCGHIIKAMYLTSSILPDDQKPAVVFVGTIHGLEFPASRVLLDWIDYLVSNYDNEDARAYAISTTNPLDDGVAVTNLSIADLIDNYRIWVVPNVSPHGMYTGSKPSARGVNIGREFEYQWASGSAFYPDGTAASPGDPRAHNANLTGLVGWTPLSQPNSRAIDGLLQFIGPSIYVTIHGHVKGIDGEYSGATLPANGPVTTCQYENSTANGPSGVNVNGNWAKPSSGLKYHWIVATPGGQNNNDILRYVYRGLDDYRTSLSVYTDDFLFDSLPFLSEQNARLFPCSTEDLQNCPPPLFYSPYSEHRVCYHDRTGGVSVDFNLTTRGHGSGPDGQSQGWAWAKYGAVSFLYEMPAYYWARDSSDNWDLNAETYYFQQNELPGAIGDYSRPKGHEENEVRLRRYLANNFYAFNRLVVLSANPLPAEHPHPGVGTGTTRHNLAVTGLFSYDANDCDITQTFWPQNGHVCCDLGYDVHNQTLIAGATKESPYGNEDTIRNGYFGKREISCQVTNWGNEAHADDFFIKLSVDKVEVNMTTIQNVLTKECFVPAGSMGAPADTLNPVIKTCDEFDVLLTKDNIYRISCEIGTHDVSGNFIASGNFNTNVLNETDDAAFSITPSAECLHSDGLIRNCTLSGGTYTKTWTTNNYRETVFKAVLDQTAICDDEVRRDQTMSGQLVDTSANVIPVSL
ncbi:MAG: M14 family zinc carboxypeptidase [Myxococcota bacterium]|nr:M14 family zinc carboxypeptidase [Myxococcota bacterium]